MTSLWSQIRVLHTADPAFPANRPDTLQEGYIVLHKLLPPFMMVRERSQREWERSYHGEKVRVKIKHKYQSGREDTMGHLSSLRHDFGNLHEWEREILNCWLALPRRIQDFTSVFLGKDKVEKTWWVCSSISDNAKKKTKKTDSSICGGTNEKNKR